MFSTSITPPLSPRDKNSLVDKNHQIRLDLAQKQLHLSYFSPHSKSYRSLKKEIDRQHHAVRIIDKLLTTGKISPRSKKLLISEYSVVLPEKYPEPPESPAPSPSPSFTNFDPPF